MISLMATSSRKGRGTVGAACCQFDNALSTGGHPRIVGSSVADVL